MTISASKYQRIMNGRGGGRGAYYKAKYGGRGRSHQNQPVHGSDEMVYDFFHENKSRSLSRNTSYELGNTLSRIDGKPYPSYKDLYGNWSFEGFTLVVDYVQGDAYASPSKFRVLIPHSVARIPSQLWNTRAREVATRDFLARTFADAVAKAGGDIQQSSHSWHGAKGGEMTVDRPSQQILDRTAVIITPQFVEARFTVALPASGRSVMGHMAYQSLVEMLPKYVQQGLMYESLNSEALRLHIATAEDAEYIREQLPGMALVAFVGDGSILPRQSGVSDEPMDSSEAIRFVSPPSMEVRIYYGMVSSTSFFLSCVISTYSAPCA